MKYLHIVTAVLEAGAGVALVCFPSAAVALMLGTGLDSSAAVALGRVAGTALLALAVACWLAHYDTQSRAARGLIAGMTLYNLGVVAILGAAGAWSRPAGILLWPVVVLHAVMTVWCIFSLRKPVPNTGTTRHNSRG